MHGNDVYMHGIFFPHSYWVVLTVGFQLVIKLAGVLKQSYIFTYNEFTFTVIFFLEEDEKMISDYLQNVNLLRSLLCQLR